MPPLSITSVVLALGLSSVGAGLPERGQPPEGHSLCPIVQNDCNVMGSRIRVTFMLGADDTVIVGGQFAFQYDPASMQFLSAAPGGNCDPASPFVQELYSSVNETTGQGFYAVGVALGGQGSAGPAAMACLEFVALNAGGGNVCLRFGASASLLVDEDGNAVAIDNAVDCPAEPTDPTLSCDEVTVGNTCTCPGGTPDCGNWTDDCNVGVCGGSPVQCRAVATNEGGPCDDGNSCTTTDRCVGGACVGTGCSNPSLCVVADDGCQASGGQLVRIMMGEGEPTILGAQFTLTYNPGAMTLLDISPGSTCDPSSPFGLEVHEDVDLFSGEVFYAVGVNFPSGETGSQGPTTMACLHFAAEGSGSSPVCMLAGVNPSTTILVDSLGDPVSVFNGEDCPTSAGPPAISCDHVDWDVDCTCTPNTGDCSALTTDCRVGFCDYAEHVCRVKFPNEGGPCDDGLECTTNDSCLYGKCRGFGCHNPSLCLGVRRCSTPDAPGEVAILLTGGDPVIVGGQFTIRYDSAALDFLEIVPGAECDHQSPFELELHEVIDEADGEVFYAVGIPVGGTGTTGPATLACIRFNGSIFTSSEVCLLRGLNPFNLLLVDENGESIEINTLDCPGNYPDPILTCVVFCDVPTVSQWGLLIMTLLMLTAAKLLRRRWTSAADRPA